MPQAWRLTISIEISAGDNGRSCRAITDFVYTLWGGDKACRANDLSQKSFGRNPSRDRHAQSCRRSRGKNKLRRMSRIPFQLFHDRNGTRTADGRAKCQRYFCDNRYFLTFRFTSEKCPVFHPRSIVRFLLHEMGGFKLELRFNSSSRVPSIISVLRFNLHRCYCSRSYLEQSNFFIVEKIRKN